MQTLKRREWSISQNARIWRIRNPTTNRMNLSIEAPNEEELEEYFTPSQSLDCNDNHGLGNNRED
jgi:hypothetical protein